MNDCTSMRARMLDAELAELEGEGRSALARHVQRCGECRLVARSLVADTDALAVLVATSPRPAASAPERIRGGVRRLNGSWRGPRARDIALALPLAAAIVLAVVGQRGTSPAPGAATSPLVGGAGTSASGVEPSSAAAAAGAPVSIEPQASRATDEEPRTPAARRAGAAIDGAQFVVAVPITSTPVVGAAARTPASRAMAAHSLSGGTDAVRVAPAGGISAMVMGTRDPAVTVVWLY